ncbi:Calcium binding EGF domain containing protein [Aphelenchoides avenae]|nr:Calcium binding EGF domain containing protein [Aphelenchus avenae]
MALDWVHGKYYWAGHDLKLGAVGVYDVATKRRRVLFSGLKSHINPAEIEVDPVEGFLFWIDSSRQAIVRTDTDGRNLTEIVKMLGIGAIALDIKERRIYWLTTFPYHAIASADYYGNNVRIMQQSCHFIDGFRPSLAVVDDRVVWTSGDALLSVAKNGSEREPRVKNFFAQVE